MRSFCRYTTGQLKEKFSVGHPFGLSKLDLLYNDEIERLSEQLEKTGHFNAESIKKALGGNEKEHDWAIAGGIGSAIGGAGLGLAAALDAQQRNAQIRERNAQRDAQADRFAKMMQRVNNSNAAIFASCLSETQAMHKEQSKWGFSISRTTQQLAAMLKTSVEKAKSEITIRLESSFSEGRIDGYMKAEIRGIGTFIVPIPYSGVGSDGASMVIRLSSEMKTSPEVRVAPIVLWAIYPECKNGARKARSITDMVSDANYASFKRDWDSLGQITVKISNGFTGKELGSIFGIGGIIGIIIGFIACIIVLIKDSKASITNALVKPFGYAFLFGIALAAILTLRDKKR